MLYDVVADPYETRNLASTPAHRETLDSLRARLDHWMSETGDAGRSPASDAMFDSDMAVYLDTLGPRPIGCGCCARTSR